VSGLLRIAGGRVDIEYVPAGTHGLEAYNFKRLTVVPFSKYAVRPG
jgi:hypothetical protein